MQTIMQRIADQLAAFDTFDSVSYDAGGPLIIEGEGVMISLTPEVLEPEEHRYWVKLTYNTVATDAKDALKTALAAIDTHSAAYVQVGRDDANGHTELEEELGLIEGLKRTPTGTYLGPDLETLIALALEFYSRFAKHMSEDTRLRAQEWADAIQNDTYLLQTAEEPGA